MVYRNKRWQAGCWLHQCVLRNTLAGSFRWFLCATVVGCQSQRNLPMQVAWRKNNWQCHTATTLQHTTPPSRCKSLDERGKGNATLQQHSDNTATTLHHTTPSSQHKSLDESGKGSAKVDTRVTVNATHGVSAPARAPLCTGLVGSYFGESTWCCSAVQCVAVCCSVLQWLECAVTLENPPGGLWGVALQHTATPCNTLFYTVIPCTTLQHPITHCNTLYHTATHYTTLQHTTPQCNTLHHTATHRLVGYCNTPPGGLLQHTAWWVTATHRLVGC